LRYHRRPTRLEPCVSHKLEPYIARAELRSVLKTRERHVARRIEQAIDLRATVRSILARLAFETRFFFMVFQLPGDNFLDGLFFFYATPNKLRALTGRVLTTGDPDNRGGGLFDVGVMRFTGEAMPPYPDVDKFSMDISYLSAIAHPAGRHSRPELYSMREAFLR
jgi:hypothetical protein